MTSLGEAFPVEQERVRQIMLSAKEIGPSGRLLVLICEDVLRRADRAAVQQDLPAMITVYREMQSLTE